MCLQASRSLQLWHCLIVKAAGTLEIFVGFLFSVTDRIVVAKQRTANRNWYSSSASGGETKENSGQVPIMRKLQWTCVLEVSAIASSWDWSTSGAPAVAKDKALRIPMGRGAVY